MAYGSGTIGAQGPQGYQGAQGAQGDQGLSYILSGNGSTVGIKAAWVEGSETTTSTTYTDLTVTNGVPSGPSVVVTSGTSVLVIISAISWNTLAAGGATNYISFNITNQNNAITHTASDTNGAFATFQYSGGAGNITRAFVVTGLTAGTNTFVMKYRTNNGTAGFNTRGITVIPL